MTSSCCILAALPAAAAACRASQTAAPQSQPAADLPQTRELPLSPVPPPGALVEANVYQTTMATHAVVSRVGWGRCNWSELRECVDVEFLTV